MLSADDHIAIQTLYSTYNQSVDHDRFAPLTDCFASDAVLVAGEKIVTGQEAIRAHFTDRASAQDSQPYVDAQHWVTNLLLEEDGELVRASCYLVRFAVDRQTRQKELVTLATYEDELISHQGRWVFRRRRAIPV